MSEQFENPLDNKPVDLNKKDDPSVSSAGSGFNTPPPFQQSAPFGQFPGMGQQDLPTATVSLVLGILALPACCFYGIFGIVFGLIAWILGASDVKKYQLDPSLYTESSYKNAKAGKICGMIATILSILFIIAIVLVIVGAISHPEAYDQFFKNLK